MLSLFVVCALAHGESKGWEANLETALQQAKKEEKNVLVQFTGSDWCLPCIMMHKEVFSKQAFLSKASKEFILVELDFPKKDKKLAEKNQPLWEKYKIEGVPTVILLDHQGKEFSRFFAAQYREVDTFMEQLEKCLEKKDLD